MDKTTKERGLCEVCDAALDALADRIVKVALDRFGRTKDGIAEALRVLEAVGTAMEAGIMRARSDEIAAATEREDFDEIVAALTGAPS